MTLTWRNALISITRYVINTATHKGSPYSNKTVIKWFLVTITIIIIMFTILPVYHVATDSIQVQTFCSQFNWQDDEDATYQNDSISLVESPKAPNMLSLEWSLTLGHFVLMLLGAALGYAADWKLKVFVKKQKLECEQMGIFIDLDDTIPVKATRISMSSIVISILAFPMRFIIGTWAFSCFLNVMLSLQVPMLAFLTFKHQQENLESLGKFGAIRNSRFMKEFPLNVVKTRRRPTKIVKRVQWKVGHWGPNGSYYEPSSLGCKEFCRWDSQNREKSHLHFNTMVTPDISKGEETPLNVSQIMSQEMSQDLSQHKTPEISLDISENVSQDLSNLSQEIQQYLTDCLSASGDISQISNEYHQVLSQDEPKNVSVCEVSVHMPECISKELKEDSQFQDKSKCLSQMNYQEPSVYTSEFTPNDNLATN